MKTQEPCVVGIERRERYRVAGRLLGHQDPVEVLQPAGDAGGGAAEKAVQAVPVGLVLGGAAVLEPGPVPLVGTPVPQQRVRQREGDGPSLGEEDLVKAAH